MKILSTFLATFLLTTPAYLMNPAPTNSPAESSKDSKEVNLDGPLWTNCPLCGEVRRFQSRQFIDDVINRLTPRQRETMIMEITTYTGEKLPGAMCPFCGVPLPVEK